MPLLTSVANAIAHTTTAPRVAPIIGITSRTATTKASATAYSLTSVNYRKISEEKPAQRATTNAPDT